MSLNYHVPIHTHSVPAKVNLSLCKIMQYRGVQLGDRFMKSRCRLAVFAQVKHFDGRVPRYEARNRLNALDYMTEYVNVGEPGLHTASLANVLNSAL